MATRRRLGRAIPKTCKPLKAAFEVMRWAMDTSAVAMWCGRFEVVPGLMKEERKSFCSYNTLRYRLIEARIGMGTPCE